MAAKRWDSHKMQGWRRGQLESFKLMSKSQVGHCCFVVCDPHVCA